MCGLLFCVFLTYVNVFILQISSGVFCSICPPTHYNVYIQSVAPNSCILSDVLLIY